jgi:hypothetical protein
MTSDGLFDRIENQIEEREGEGDQAPLTMSDILDLPDDQRSLMRYVLRSAEPLTPGEVAEGLGWEIERTQRIVGDVSFIGMIDLVDGRIKVAPMQRNTRSTPGGMWRALDDL